MSHDGESSDSAERRSDVHRRLYELGDRVTRVETLWETSIQSQKDQTLQTARLVEVMQEVSLKLNTLETQRNTVIASAGLIGALLTTIGHAIFRFMVGAK